MSGEFTVIEKIKSSLKENLKYYCLFGLLFTFFLIYYASKERPTIEGLKIFCISASNTFGLFLLVILMGYGLVDIPRSFLKDYHCNYQYKLNYLYFKIGKISEEKYNANLNLDDLYDEIRSSCQKIFTENRYRYLIKYLQIIINKCPDTFQEEMLKKIEILQHSNSNERSNSELTIKDLVILHSMVKKAIQASHRTQVQYEFLIKQAVKLEDIIKNLNTLVRTDVTLSATERWFGKHIPKGEYLMQWKHVIVYKIFFPLIGYIFAILSVIIVWSEFTFSIKKIPISIFALIIKVIDDYFWIEVSRFLRNLRRF